MMPRSARSSRARRRYDQERLVARGQLDRHLESVIQRDCEHPD